MLSPSCAVSPGQGQEALGPPPVRVVHTQACGRSLRTQRRPGPRRCGAAAALGCTAQALCRGRAGLCGAHGHRGPEGSAAHV